MPNNKGTRAPTIRIRFGHTDDDGNVYVQICGGKSSGEKVKRFKSWDKLHEFILSKLDSGITVSINAVIAGVLNFTGNILSPPE